MINPDGEDTATRTTSPATKPSKMNPITLTGNYYGPRFTEILNKARNEKRTTPTEKREMLAELFYLSALTGSQFDHLTGHPLSWYNWTGVARNIERLREEYENQ